MAAPVLQFKRGLLANLPGLRAGEPGFTTDSYDLYVGLTSETSTNKFLGSHRYWTKNTATTGSGVNLVEGTDNGTSFLTLKAPDSLSGIGTYVFPDTTDGSTGDFLKLTSYTGNVYTLEWAAVPSGSFTLAADSGSNDTFTTGETLTFTGGTNLNSVVSDNQITFNLDDNVSVTNLNVTGITTLAGNIILGDNTSDDITVGGEFVSSLNPSTSGNYDLGTSSQRWRNAWFSGNVNVAGIITAVGYSDLTIANKDIVMAYIDGVTETDTTANHGGIAVASTEGTPLIDIGVVGINTLPNTYKQIMWVKKDTFTGLATDAWMFNYGVAIGTTTMANGVRLAVGTGVSITDTQVYASSFIKPGGTSSEFLKADGSVDSTTYLTSYTETDTLDDVTGRGNSTINGISVGILTATSGNFSGIITSSGAVISGVVTSNGYNATTGNDYKINGTSVLSSTTLGSGVVSSSLTSVGTLSALTVSGDSTHGTLKLSGTSGIGITGISTSATLTENSDNYLPTQKAVKAYVDAVDVTLGIDADTGGPSTVATSQTLTISGTANEVNTSVSGQTVTVGLPDTVNITTLLDVPTVEASNLKARDGTTAITITDSTGAVATNADLTVGGNLYVNGSTTQVNTTSLTVEDTLVELGLVDGNAPSSDVNKDLGLLFNYYTDSAKKAGVYWDDSASRIVLGSEVTESTGVLTASAYAALEIGSLWVNDCAGQSQVINCSGTTRTLENITIDGGSF